MSYLIGMDEDLRNRFRRDFTRETINRNQTKYTGSTQTQTGALTPTVNDIEAAAPDKSVETLAPSVPSAPPIPETESPTSDTLNSLPLPNLAHPVAKPVKQRRRGRAKIVITSVTLCLLMAAGGGLAVYQYNNQSKLPTIPAAIATKAEMPILYPERLPDGYQIVKSSFNVTTSNVVAFYAEDKSGHRLNFTIQARPANFDFEKFYTQIISNATRFNTSIGEAAVGKANGHLLGSLATTQSWALVTGNNDSVGATNIQTALNSLKVVTLSK